MIFTYIVGTANRQERRPDSNNENKTKQNHTHIHTGTNWKKGSIIASPN